MERLRKVPDVTVPLIRIDMWSIHFAETLAEEEVASDQVACNEPVASRNRQGLGGCAFDTVSEIVKVPDAGAAAQEAWQSAVPNVAATGVPSELMVWS